MKNSVQHYWQHFQRLILRGTIWLFAFPAGWWLMTTSYRLQKHWTDTRFVACYLLLYILLGLCLLLLQKSPVTIPGLASWGVLVFAGIGLGRLVWAMVQYEYATGVELSLRSTLLLLILGTGSLTWLARIKRRRLTNTRQKTQWIAVPRRNPAENGEAVSAMHEEMHLW